MTDTSALRAFIEARLADDDQEAERLRLAGFNTGRALREVAAKRAILAAYTEDYYGGSVSFGDWEACSDSCAPVVMEHVLGLLASVWSDHDEYQQSWAAENATPSP
jgi:hypothetical protein